MWQKKKIKFCKDPESLKQFHEDGVKNAEGIASCGQEVRRKW